MFTTNPLIPLPSRAPCSKNRSRVSVRPRTQYTSLDMLQSWTSSSDAYWHVNKSQVFSPHWSSGGTMHTSNMHVDNIRSSALGSCCGLTQQLCHQRRRFGCRGDSVIVGFWLMCRTTLAVFSEVVIFQNLIYSNIDHVCTSASTGSSSSVWISLSIWRLRCCISTWVVRRSDVVRNDTSSGSHEHCYSAFNPTGKGPATFALADAGSGEHQALQMHIDEAWDVTCWPSLRRLWQAR